MTATHWGPGLYVVTAGFVLAVGLIALFFRSRKGSAPSAPLQGDDFRQRRQNIVDQLKELEVDRLQLGSGPYQLEKQRLEQAALLLHQNAQLQPSATVKPTSSNYPQLKGALWGGGTVLFFGTLGVLLFLEQKPRPPESSTSSKQETKVPERSDVDPSLDAEVRRAEESSQDVDEITRLAHLLMLRQRFADADSLTEKVAALDPFALENRVHRAILAVIKDRQRSGAAAIEHLAVLYPSASEAWLFLGAFALQKGDKPTALTSLKRYLAEVPEAQRPPMLVEGIRQLTPKP